MSLYGRNRPMRSLALVVSVCVWPGVLQGADDPVDFGTLLGTGVACAVAGAFLADMPAAPLYRVSDAGSCEAIDPAGQGSGQPLYTDADCIARVVFRDTSLDTFCARVADEESIGLGLDIVDDAWTLAPGSRFDIGARSLDGVVWPYRQRLVYHTVSSDRGQCELEMRIYKSHPGAQGDRSLIAWHGGSWTNRGFGSVGLELTIPHLVAQGFTVYAPFYRLLGEPSSSNAALAACQGSDISAITEDALVALDWVIDHADLYGSSGKPVLFGQSAGAHLAVSLAVNRAADVAGAVAFYPPADFADFLASVQQGLYTDEQGLGVLQRILDGDPVSYPLDQSPVPENSFPSIIAADPAAFPPMFLVHGQADTLVEERQSVRLCQALAGEPLQPLDDPVETAATLRDVRPCGGIPANGTAPGSQLHLVREGRHALDICLADLPVSNEVCLSGSAASRELVADSIGQAAAFALAAAESADDDGGEDGGETVESSGSGGGLNPVSVIVLLLGFVGLRQRHG